MYNCIALVHISPVTKALPAKVPIDLILPFEPIEQG